MQHMHDGGVVGQSGESVEASEQREDGCTCTDRPSHIPRASAFFASAIITSSRRLPCNHSFFFRQRQSQPVQGIRGILSASTEKRRESAGLQTDSREGHPTLLYRLSFLVSLFPPSSSSYSHSKQPASVVSCQQKKAKRSHKDEGAVSHSISIQARLRRACCSGDQIGQADSTRPSTSVSWSAIFSPVSSRTRTARAHTFVAGTTAHFSTLYVYSGASS